MSAAWKVIVGDCRKRLADLPAESVQTVVTSPPYFGLRDYGTARWEGGSDPECDHRMSELRRGVNLAASSASTRGGGKKVAKTGWLLYPDVCAKCGALRIDEQIGREEDVPAYVEALVEVFREVRRVLRDDGTVWLNLGDSYSAHGAGAAGKELDYQAAAADRTSKRVGGVKPKNLLMVPARVALALQADGWYLRSEIVWHKPNPLPESVTDRPSKAHEMLYLFAKSERYFYDADAIREPHAAESLARVARTHHSEDHKYVDGGPGNHTIATDLSQACNPKGANRRDVWTVATKPYPGAHFATFPPKLIEPCILAGSRAFGTVITDPIIFTPLGEGGGDDPTLQTGRAGMNRQRGEDEGTRPMTRGQQAAYAEQLKASPHRAQMIVEVGASAFGHYTRTDIAGARPIPPEQLEEWLERGWLEEVAPLEPVLVDESCCTVLDPFAGAGTTGIVALRHGRSFVGIELNPEYAEMARWRIRDDQPLFNVQAEVPSDVPETIPA